MIADAAASALENVQRREESVRAYFVAAAEHGRMTFTQSRDFALEGGALLDVSGRPVLGYTDDNSPLQPLQIDPLDVALGYAQNPVLSADGKLSYERTAVDPENGEAELERITAGRLGIARFAPGVLLPRIDATHRAAPPGVVPHLEPASARNLGDLKLERLQDALLTFDAVRAAGKAHGAAEKTAMDLLK